MMNFQKIESFLLLNGIEYEMTDGEEITILEDPDSPLYIDEDGMGWKISDDMEIKFRINSNKDLDKIYQMI